MSEVEKAKVVKIDEAKPKLDEVKVEVEAKKQYMCKVVKVQVMPLFHIIDEDGNIVGETQASTPIMMYPGKFLSFKELTKRLEEDSLKNDVNVRRIAESPLW